ncbi:DUF3187 family protein [Ancylomarina sp. DW003]|nr:DUF3187 family protein [Ancylomarina sp. DW003]MDE5423187.1 DUF3187 family protein [Ancylomarina sp. DW003]
MLRLLSLILFFILTLKGFAQNDVRPFKSHNQSPLFHFFGLPYSDGGKLLAKNNYFLSTNLSIASNSTNALTPNEVVYFDGEMMRLDLHLAYACSDRFEIGLNVPIVRHSGGFMDSSIDGFHRFIGINGGARAKTPQDELRYAYIQNGESYFNSSDKTIGIGDISLKVAYQLLNGKRHALALRSNIKFSTGNKDKLIGSGTFDWSLQLSGQTKGIGTNPVYFFYSLGYLRVGDGAILESMQINNVLFGSLGMAVKVNTWFVPKLQLDYHSRFYKNSQTQELGDYSMQFLLGSDFILNSKMILTVGFTEDMKINTSPDFVLHIGASYTF